MHFLTHAGTADNPYWDFAWRYSYIDIDIAAEATFTYDRLGTGKSDPPDPLQVVQAGIQIEIAHILTTLLKNGTFGGYRFEKVVGGSSCSLEPNAPNIDLFPSCSPKSQGALKTRRKSKLTAEQLSKNNSALEIPTSSANSSLLSQLNKRVQRPSIHPQRQT